MVRYESQMGDVGCVSRWGRYGDHVCGILSVTEYGKDVRWDNATHIDSYGNESKCEEG